MKLKSGSKEPGRNIIGSISKQQLKDIAEKKMEDLNAHDIEEAAKMSKDINVRLMLQISNRFTENDPLRPINPKYNGNRNNEDQRYIAS